MKFFALFIFFFALCITPSFASEAVPEPTAAPIDEFKSVDEFSEFKAEPVTTTPSEPGCNGTCSLTKNEEVAFRWVLGILFATIVAGVLVRFKTTRNLRAVFLVASVVVGHGIFIYDIQKAAQAKR